MSQAIALTVLQLVALAIPPIAVLIQLLRKSENLPWRMRKWSFGMAIVSVISFILSGVAVVTYFLQTVTLPLLLTVGLAAVIVGLVPFALFTMILYREHKDEFGP